MFLVEAANTVKRYSAFPKTITSNPKSHFVFGVLPIAHLNWGNENEPVGGGGGNKNNDKMKNNNNNYKSVEFNSITYIHWKTSRNTTWFRKNGRQTLVGDSFRCFQKQIISSSNLWSCFVLLIGLHGHPTYLASG